MVRMPGRRDRGPAGRLRADVPRVRGAYGERRLWLGDLYVRTAARRSGAGRSLVAAVANRALELDCEAVYWELWRPNALGKAFYDRLAAEEAADLAVMRLGGERLSAAAQPPSAGDRQR